MGEQEWGRQPLLSPALVRAHHSTFHWLEGNFSSQPLCAIFPSASLSLDTVSLDLFSNTSILFCLYCILSFLCLFYPFSTIAIVLAVQKTWEASLGSTTFSNNQPKWPEEKIIIRHPFKNCCLGQGSWLITATQKSATISSQPRNNHPTRISIHSNIYIKSYLITQDLFFK